MSRRPVGRYIAAICAYLVGYKIVSRAKDASRQAEHKAYRALQTIPITKGDIASVTDESGQTKKQNREAQEESYWFWTKWASVTAAIGAIVAAGLAAGAFYQARRQADAAEANNRPWLAITGLDIDEINILDKKVSIKWIIKYKNVGHSPALSVYLTGRTEPQLDAVLGPETGKSDCNEAIEARREPPQHVVFPDTGEQKSEISEYSEVGFYNSTQQDSIERYVRKSINPPKNFVATDQSKQIFLAIKGCVTYLIEDNARTSIHGTSFLFNLNAKTIKANKTGGSTIDMTENRALHAEDIAAVAAPVGVYAN